MTVILLSMMNSIYADPIPGFDPVGADAAAMAGAVTALSQSSTNIYHNPACLVDQVLSGGFGIQPVRFNEFPRSWWINLYNRSTDYGYPLSLIMQGWKQPTFDGERQNFMVGIPFAYKFSPYSPAALNFKWAMEKTPDGEWIGGFPVDFGFMARTNTGATYGMVFRNIVIGGNRFETMKRRTDLGLAYEAGVATYSIGTTADSWDELKQSGKRIRTGFELSSNPSLALRGGFVRWDEENGEGEGRWYTGGVGLRSLEARMFVDYAFVYDQTNEDWKHFVQYVYMMR
ncbi:MAG: hypothetical protein P9L92_13160 [Candidatus Electryonea clarkiae]|nr:hypothetical protein [Candidatus Electryonea clarkiae]MDP8285569.1 hypothetical protein [Candidatus Electryonea clarkiae]